MQSRIRRPDLAREDHGTPSGVGSPDALSRTRGGRAAPNPGDDSTSAVRKANPPFGAAAFAARPWP